MTLVNYGDIFYLYGLTSRNLGWLVSSKDSPPDEGPYYVLCQNCGANQPFSLKTFTILPGVSNPSASTNMFINTMGVNVQGKPVDISDSFFLADSSILPNSRNKRIPPYGNSQNGWSTQKQFLAVTKSYGDAFQTNIDKNPNSSLLEVANLVNPAGPTLRNYAYGLTQFNLNLPFNTIGSNCNGLFTKQSLFGLDLSHITENQAKVAPNLNPGCNKHPLDVIAFIFVPVNAVWCGYDGKTCTTLNLSTMTEKTIGYPLFTSKATCDCSISPERYACTGPGGTCVVSGDGPFASPDCNRVCSINRYSCHDGVCKTDPNGNFGESTCGGTCNNSTGKNSWWVWIIVAVVVLLLTAGIVGGIVYYYWHHTILQPKILPHPN